MSVSDFNNDEVNNDEIKNGFDENLSHVLLQKRIVKESQIKEAQEKIGSGDKRQLGSILVGMKALSRTDLIKVIAEFIDLPKAKIMLDKIEKRRKPKERNKISSGVEANQSPFVMDDKKVQEDLFFTDGNVKIKGPELDLSEFKDCDMDELQVAQMATMLLEKQQWEETEAYLIEAIQDFPKSIILRYQLIWLYNATGYQQKAIENCRIIEGSDDLNNQVNELLAWTMLKNLKLLESIRFYQILCNEKKRDAIWFYLLAMCLFKSKLLGQSKTVFEHYLTIEGISKELANNAQFYLAQIPEQL